MSGAYRLPVNLFEKWYGSEHQAPDPSNAVYECQLYSRTKLPRRGWLQTQAATPSVILALSAGQHTG